MPRREHQTKKGKFGQIYKVARGVTVRKDHRNMWCLEISRKTQRKSVTFGSGPEGRAKAIQAAEEVAKRLRHTSSSPAAVETATKPTFVEFQNL